MAGEMKIPLNLRVDDATIKKLDKLVERFKEAGHLVATREEVARQAMWKGMDVLPHVLTRMQLDQQEHGPRRV